MITATISYSEEEIPPGFEEERILQVLTAISAHSEASGEVDISIVSRETMSELNSSYRGKEGSTDILSFATFDVDEPFPTGDLESYLGELIISPDDVFDNCTYFSVDPDNEIIRILVHGILHLKGFDHETTEEEEPMLMLQERIVAQVEKELQG